LLLRGHLPDAEPDRRQSRHRVQCLRVRSQTGPALRRRPASQAGAINMSSATAIIPQFASVAPTVLAAPVLANVLYEKRDAIAYVTVNRPKVLNALNAAMWQDLRTAF